jgi:hypothetical protein
MSQNAVFAPIGALALITFLVLGLMPLHRVRAVREGYVGANDFRYGESAAVPPFAAIINRNYINLLELPLLFYVICLIFHAANRVDIATLRLAWTFSGLRLVHSLVHLTYNHVLHRLGVYAVSNVALGLLWIRFFV